MSRHEHLRGLLERHEPRDDRERASSARTLELLARAGDPFSKHRYEPGHVTTSGFVLSPDGSALLMILHASLGRWLQPGGHVDSADDDVLAAARREVREEVGLDGLPLAGGVEQIFDVDVHRIPERDPHPAHRHFDVRFLFRATGLGVRAGSDARSARWVPLARLAANAATDPSLRRVLAKLGC